MVSPGPLQLFPRDLVLIFRTMATDDPRREQLIQKVKSRLLRHGLPRFQMFILVALTGAAGFLSAYALLRLGLESMALRYPIAVAIAYGVFLLLLRVWLAIQERGWGVLTDTADGLDLVELVPHGSGGGDASHFAGDSMPEPSDGEGSWFDFISLDFDEGGILLLITILILVVTALGAAFWIVWMAPALLAELLVDGLVMVAVYRRLKRSGGPPYWLFGAVRRTWVTAVVAAVLFSFAGGLLHRAVPEARSIGEAWKSVNAASRLEQR
jgi:hypothetical protein